MYYRTTTSDFAPAPTPHAQGRFNTLLAEAHANADRRFNQKSMDRGGVSRGAGTAAMAGIQAAQKLAEGTSEAYGSLADDASKDADNQLQYQANQENFGQGLYGIAMQNDYANALAALQRTQNNLQYQRGALGGLLGSSVNLGSFGNYDGTY